MSVFAGLLCVDLGVFASMYSIARLCIADAIQQESAPVAEAHGRFNTETYFLRRLRRNVVLINFCGRLKGSNTRGVSWNLKDITVGNYWGILLFKRCMRRMWGVVGGGWV
jgi:hypothetical protein